MHEKINKVYAMLGIIKRNFNYLTISGFFLIIQMYGKVSFGLLQFSMGYKKGDIELLEKFKKGNKVNSCNKNNDIH